MTDRLSRRDLMKSTAAFGAAWGLHELGFLRGLPLLSAADTQADPKIVKLDPSIEPVVQLIEKTPRDKLLEEVASRIKQGLSYRELLAALQLAGVRNVQPRPSVGFKFHAVLVVNSAHIASQSSPPEHRWLPIFWALDQYKASEARDVAEGNWTMPPVDESAVPAAHQARDTFTAAMENWDEAKADAAVAGLARTAGANEIYEQFFRLGARDFRSIGHKAIFVANSCRTLQAIGWQHAEPVLRSLTYALLMHEGGNPATGDAEADRPYRRNQELAQKIRPEWREGKLDKAATNELLQTLRTGTNDDVCDLVVEQLNRGVSPQSIWDALFVQSGELLMRQPGIVALHTVTTTNAMRYAFQESGNDETRRLLLLQNAAFIPMFRDAMQSRGKVAATTIDDLKPAELKNSGQDALTQIFQDIRRNPGEACTKTLAYLQQTSGAQQLMDQARVNIFLKGTDSHDYKFSSAVLEDYYHISSEWRDLFLSLSVFNLRGTTEPDNSLVARTKAALA